MGKGANASVVRNSPQLNDQSSGRKYTQIHGQVRPNLSHACEIDAPEYSAWVAFLRCTACSFLFVYVLRFTM